jgi:transposase
VGLKSEAQQAVLMLHRMRQQLVKMRTMQVNELRGLLYELGAELPRGRQRGIERMGGELERLERVLPAVVVETLRQQLKRIEGFDRDIGEIEKKLAQWKKEDEAVRRLLAIPGVGLLSATAALATIGEAKAFKSGREFAAFLGLVPRQSGTGGRVKLLGISKRGDVYLRTLLIHGARSVITHAKQREMWIDKLVARRPLNVAVVALANKIARTIWALLAHDRTYEKEYVARAA